MRSAAVALIFRPRHDGQKPRPLQLNATSRVSSQLPQPPAIQSATRSAGWTALSGILERVLDDDQIEESAFVCNCRRNAGAVDRLSVLARRNTLSTTLLAATAAPSPTPAERSRPDAPTRSTRRKRRGRPFAAGHVRRDLLRGRALPLRTGRFATGSGAARLHERDRSGEGGVSRFECRLKNHQPHHRPSRQARPRRRPALRHRSPDRSVSVQATICEQGPRLGCGVRHLPGSQRPRRGGRDPAAPDERIGSHDVFQDGVDHAPRPLDRVLGASRGLGGGDAGPDWSGTSGRRAACRLRRGVRR